MSPSDPIPDPRAARGSQGVGAVVVTFNPDWTLLGQVLRTVAPQVVRGVVVDNASHEQGPLRDLLPPNFELVANERNLGIGAALNQGVARLGEQGSLDWILTLDQDTVVDPQYVEELLRHVRTGASRRPVGIVTAVLPASSTGTRRLLPAEFVYATGNLVRSSVFAGGTRFREEFFMDQIDHHFCHEVRTSGFDILVYDLPLFTHEHGQTRTLMGRLVRFEPSSRFYYIVRNSTVLLREGRLPLALYLRQLAQWGVMLALCDNPFRALRGLFDGMGDALAGEFTTAN